jgi:hypothetical protein
MIGFAIHPPRGEIRDTFWRVGPLALKALFESSGG